MQVAILKKVIRFLVIISIFLCAPVVQALRCGTSLVELGDNAEQVASKCGKPTKKIYMKQKIHEGSHVVIVVSGEKWIYNFGPTEFLYVLRFSDDTLIEIKTNGYGY